MLTHEFFSLPERTISYDDWGDYINAPEGLVVDDGLVLYMMDTLRWIPSINPSNPKELGGYGLNYYGPTVIHRGGARKAARILRLWASLLQEGPSELELTGSYEFDGDDPADMGRYEMITLSRESVVKTINDIAILAEAAISGNFFVLHIGI